MGCNSILENKLNFEVVLNTNRSCSQEAFTFEFCQKLCQVTIKSLISFCAEHQCWKKWLDIIMSKCHFSWKKIPAFGGCWTKLACSRQLTLPVSQSWERQIHYILAQSSYSHLCHRSDLGWERSLDVWSLHDRCLQTPINPVVWHLLQTSSLTLREHEPVQVGVSLPLR